MWSVHTASGRFGARHSFSNYLSRYFPTPEILAPRSAGIDISDSSVKWMIITPDKETNVVASYGSETIPDGVIEKGAIRDAQSLAGVLRNVKAKMGRVSQAHAALPEEAAYVFSMHVPEKTARGQIMGMIEFELEDRVPLSPRDAVYDFRVIMEHDDGIGAEIGVVVFPSEFAKSYVQAFESAGIELLSLELEAYSIARTISSKRADEPVTLSVDFGRERTGFAVLKRGIPIFSSTVDVGGDAITHAVMEKLSLSPEEAQAFKNDQGLLAEGAKSAGLEALVGAASALSDEVAKHYHYWDTRRNDKGEHVTPVGMVSIVGGSANLKGLADYIAGRIQATTELPNVWRNVCSFDKYIPPIDAKESLRYATAIGLALRGI
ncbi:MAG: pilus assembly protein PilM [Candidatus Kaiserbacteria bacterium]|nr:pilus assembly protein PilM [Candidatus Kaiserbacteria bacterium]